MEQKLSGHTLPPTCLFPSLTATQWTPLTWQGVLEMLRGTTLRDATLRYRTAPTAGIKQGMPAIITMVELIRQGRRASDQGAYTGIIMMDFDDIPEDRVEHIREAVNADPHTLLSYVTLSGQGLRVFARLEAVPRDKAEFLAAWQMANGHYATLTGFAYDGQCKNANRMSVLCHDPKAFFNPGCLPFPMEARMEQAPPVHHHTSATKAAEVVRAAAERDGKQYVAGHHHEYIVHCMFLMNRLGVPENEAVAWAKQEFADSDAPDNNVETITRGIYRDNTAQHGGLLLCRLRQSLNYEPNTDRGGRRKASVKQMTAYISERLRLRRNLFTRMVEYLDGDHWQPLDDRMENSLWCRMEQEGMNPDLGRLHTLLGSDWVPDYNPLLEYLNALPRWDGKDHLRQLADRVRCKDTPADVFAMYFSRWMVGMVAAALDNRVTNQTIFVLVGPQGIYKSSFMERLLPPELRPYFAVKGNAQRMTKDDYFTMTENLIINLEEIDSMRPYELNQLKAMVTQTHIDERPAYGRNKVHRPHIASFCGTGNNIQFLNDDTGNRRWLPFEVERIENPFGHTLPYAQIYAQIKALLADKSFHFWFSKEEVEAINHRNRRFETPNPARELIVKHYAIPSGTEREEYLTSAEIVMRFGTTVRLNAVQVGRTMRELGFKCVRCSHTNMWRVVSRTTDAVQHQLPAAMDRVEDMEDMEDVL